MKIPANAGNKEEETIAVDWNDWRGGEGEADQIMLNTHEGRRNSLGQQGKRENNLEWRGAVFFRSVQWRGGGRGLVGCSCFSRQSYTHMHYASNTNKT